MNRHCYMMLPNGDFTSTIKDLSLALFNEYGVRIYYDSKYILEDKCLVYDDLLKYVVEEFELVSYKNIVPEKKKFNCEICSIVLPFSKFVNHMKNEHNSDMIVREGSFICNTCGLDITDVEKHLNIHGDFDWDEDD